MGDDSVVLDRQACVRVAAVVLNAISGARSARFQEKALINEYAPTFLREVSQKAIEARERGSHHVDVENLNVPENNMATLAPEGPYAFTTYRNDPGGWGNMRLHIATSYDEVLNYYRAMHSRVDALDWLPINCVQGGWYSFQHGIGHTRLKADGSIRASEMLVMLPTFGKAGITGELYWFRHPDPLKPVDPPGGPHARIEYFARHNDLLDAYRDGAVDRIVAFFTETCQSATCDYVTESGTLACLYGREDLRAYHEALFDKFKVRSVEPVQRTVDDWFVFSELLWTLESQKDGRVLSCNTAGYWALAPDGRYVSQVGHGTALAAIT
jgi:hypothetical protein